MKQKFLIASLMVLVMAASASAFSGHQAWSFQPEATVSSGIAVSGNTVFFGSETGRCYAVNKNTGRLIWEFKAENSIYGVPSVSGGKVFFAEGDGTVLCLNASTGEYLWASGGFGGKDTRGRDVNDGLSDGAVIGGGLIYVSKDDRKVHALNENNGKTAWTYTTGDQGVRSAPAYANGIVFVGEYDGIFSMLDAKSGKRLNGGGAGGAVNTPSVNNGNVYFSAWDGSVNAVQIKDVIPLWHVNVKDTITTQPEISGGRIFVGTGRGTVIALSENDGRMLWRFDTNCGSISSKPVAADGLVFVGAESGPMFVIDASNGKQVGFVGSEEGITGNPAYSEGRLFFGNGAVYAYD